jgi:2-polyprenyl-6-methoxyphenol hydroxylase-like FAD-dependent oxidoreductase
MRALIIGGSLGGLLAANLLARDGWDVEVFEQADEALAGRGAGIISHPELFRVLQIIGVTLDDSYGVDIPLRATYDRSGAMLARLESQQIFTSWGRLYQLLKPAFPAGRYHLGHSFQSLEQDRQGVIARFAGGGTARGDLLIGADGIRSSVRA